MVVVRKWLPGQAHGVYVIMHSIWKRQLPTTDYAFDKRRVLLLRRQQVGVGIDENHGRWMCMERISSGVDAHETSASIGFKLLGCSFIVSANSIPFRSNSSRYSWWFLPIGWFVSATSQVWTLDPMNTLVHIASQDDIIHPSFVTAIAYSSCIYVVYYFMHKSTLSVYIQNVEWEDCIRDGL